MDTHVPENVRVDLSTKGPVPQGVATQARDKLLRLCARVREPVQTLQIRLAVEPDPARARPAVAEATIGVDGTPVRAHVAADRVGEAVDLLVERLSRRIDRYESRHHRLHVRHRTGTHAEGEWRHGDLPTQRPEYFERPYDERDIVRRKTFALAPMTIDEAAFDLDMLGHDFYLFTEIETGQDAVLAHAEEGLELHHPAPESLALNGVAAAVRLVERPPVLTETEARERLDTGGETLVFFVSAETQRGAVVYHRYDGHYGVIEPA